MRIATFNVNGVNGRLPVLLRWLAEAQPDVACLQELKAPQERLPHQAIRDAGYHAIWHGQKAWNGVAILAREGEPVEAARALPGDPEDIQSRYLEATVGGVRIGCLYLPNGNPAPGPKFDYKLRWFDRLTMYAASPVTSVIEFVQRFGELVEIGFEPLQFEGLTLSLLTQRFVVLGTKLGDVPGADVLPNDATVHLL